MPWRVSACASLVSGSPRTKLPSATTPARRIFLRGNPDMIMAGHDRPFLYYARVYAGLAEMLGVRKRTIDPGPHLGEVRPNETGNAGRHSVATGIDDGVLRRRRIQARRGAGGPRVHRAACGRTAGVRVDHRG